MYTGNLKPISKQLVIECSLSQLGVWQLRASHQLESIELGSRVESGQSHTEAGQDIAEAALAAVEHWLSSPWALEVVRPLTRS